MISKEEKLISRLKSCCARREYCEKDIYRKALEALDGDSEKAEVLLSLLKKDKFVDNARYACAFASDKSSIDGWGPHKIRMALRAKDISDAEISSALEGVDAVRSSGKLDRLLAAKWKLLSDDPNGRLKLIRYALSRGYEYDQVSAAVERVTKDCISF